MVQSLWKTTWQLLKKLNIELPYNPAVSKSYVYSQEDRKHVHAHTQYINVHSSSIMHDSQKVQIPQINKMWCTHSKEYYLTIKNKILIHATTWMNLKNIKLNERSQMYKIMYYLIPFT